MLCKTENSSNRMKEEIQDLGRLTWQEFLKELKIRYGDLRGYSYEVTQPAYLSNYYLNEDRFTCGIAAKFNDYPYPIHLGQGRFLKLSIYNLNCPSLDISACSFKIGVFLEEITTGTPNSIEFGSNEPKPLKTY